MNEKYLKFRYDGRSYKGIKIGIGARRGKRKNRRENSKPELIEFEIIENKIVEDTMCARITKHTRYEPKLWPIMISNVENSATTFDKRNNVKIMKDSRNAENRATTFR